jgi:hypothetical protein
VAVIRHADAFLVVYTQEGRGPSVQDAVPRPTAEQAAADVRAPGTLPPGYCQIQGFETRIVGSKGG